MVGSNRIVPVSHIIHPLGNPEVSPEGEKQFRRSIVQQALEALKEA